MQKRTISLYLAIFFCLSLGVIKPARAVTIEVTHPQSIQTAINNANNGDTVLVHDGVYVENIDFLGKEITVKSENGAGCTTINPAGGKVVTMNSGESQDTILDGFTITGGSGSSGGGIYLISASPVIKNCIINGNSSSTGGGGIHCNLSSPNIVNCIISGNTGFPGGGMYCGNFSSPSIMNSTISGNWASGGGGIWCNDSSSPVVVNSILWGNHATVVGNEISLYHSSSINISYSDIDPALIYTDATAIAATLNSNINSDPKFKTKLTASDSPSTLGNLHLKVGSPCIDSGTNTDAPDNDIDGQIRIDEADIGADEYYLCYDIDGDGYYNNSGCGTLVDCNDSNSLINQGMTELCNGVDDNCDGEIDNNFVFTDYYQDSDLDGYGNADSVQNACSHPVGYVTDDNDCNDSDDDQYPGNPEICDGKDNDCNSLVDDNLTGSINTLQEGVCSGSVKTCSGAGGWIDDYTGVVGYEVVEVSCDNADNDCDSQVDEGVKTTYYRDMDGDGFGNIDITQDACSAPDGYVANNTDCHDYDFSVNPGAPEICNNGTDDDCDGQIDGPCRDDGPVTLTDPVTSNQDDVVYSVNTVTVPVGQNIEVSLLNLDITFDSVSTEGDITVSTSQTGTSYPADFEMQGVYYNISTTAEYSGYIDVCVTYDSDMLNNSEEQNLHLLHYDTDHWEDIMVSLDNGNNMVCGQTESFSEFILAHNTVTDYDVDEDGYGVEIDCDDNNPSIYECEGKTNTMKDEVNKSDAGGGPGCSVGGLDNTGITNLFLVLFPLVVVGIRKNSKTVYYKKL